MYSKSRLTAVVLAVLATMLATVANAQSNLGELLDKGGSKMLKADYIALAPFRVKYVWFQGGGEGDLVYAANGTLTGTEYHYPSRSESPAVGTWTVDDSGKWCIKKNLEAWNSKTDVCWYSFRLGDEYFGTLSETDRNARVGKIKSVSRHQ
ncbi:MAG: hypothetical protein ACTS6J_23240 [Burkholderiales bacterium]